LAKFFEGTHGFTGCINKVLKNSLFSFKTIKDFKIYFLHPKY